MRPILFVGAIIVLAVAGCGRESSDQGSSGTLTGSDQAQTNAYQPDNSGINERDRSTNALTAGDQGSTEADRELARRIRQAIVKSDQLSVYADNVKIIAANGKVTLRGPVRSQEEILRISSLVQNTAGVTAVDNQLEVKQQ